MTTQKPTTAVAKPYDLVDSVAVKVRSYTENGELLLPANYSIENALKSAWLILQKTVDKDKKPVLEVCTKTSIANSLLDMTVQALNPSKKQCYFIAYGNKLFCQRSYFGTMAVAKRVAKASDIWAEVVYKDDEFEYEIRRNRKAITKHVQRLENINGQLIVAAYCVIEFDNGQEPYTEIMTIEQIKKAWAKSKYNPNGDGSTHQQFPDEMAKRTVINRSCKKFVNSSSDDNLFMEHFNRTDDEQAEEEIAEEIAERANRGGQIDRCRFTGTRAPLAGAEHLRHRQLICIVQTCGEFVQ